MNLRESLRFVVLCLVLAGSAPRAGAQDLISRYLDPSTDPFSAADILDLARRAEFTPDQQSAAMDLLEDARRRLTIAQRSLQRAQWRLQAEVTEPDEEKREKLIREQSRKAMDTLAERSEAIEREFLDDLRGLVGGGEKPWQQFLRDRRLMAFNHTGWFGLPDLDRLVRSLELSADERRNVAQPLEVYWGEMDPIVKDHLAFVYENRKKERSNGVDGEDMSEAMQARQRAIYARAIEAFQRGTKTVADELTPEHAAELATLVEVHKFRRLMNEDRVMNDDTVSDLMRISTLTTQQKSAMRAMVRKTQAEIAKNFRPLMPVYEAYALGKSYDSDSKQEQLYEQASAASGPLLVKLRESLLTALTADQRDAFNKGEQPPLADPNRHWGEDIERAR